MARPWVAGVQDLEQLVVSDVPVVVNGALQSAGNIEWRSLDSPGRAL
jgi:hypothetical protein